ncbi:MAG: SPOR domain-containing protein [Magnetococcales bacterium]|nr:SPOR domain-containing protein [Magnetococcales bacterium]
MAFVCALCWPLEQAVSASKTSHETGTQANDNTQKHFTLLTEPADAKVEILNVKAPYKTNMLLKAGRYHIVVSAPGYETEKGFIDITEQDWIGKVVLRPLNQPPQAKEQPATNEAEQEAAREKLKQEQQKLEQEQQKLEQERRALNQEKEKLEQERRALNQEKEKLEQGHRALNQEKEKLDAAKQELAQAQLALAERKKSLETQQSPCPAPPETRAIPAEPTAVVKPAEPTAVVKSAPTAEQLPADSGPDPSRAVPIPQTTPRGKNKMPPPQEKEQDEEKAIQATAVESGPLALEHASNLEDKVAVVSPAADAAPPPPGAAVADDGAAAPVLAKAMAYLQQVRPTRSGPPPEGAVVLRELRQAQQADPNNAAIQRALQLYEKRYLIYTALLGNKEKADEMLKRVHALKIPAFLQSLEVKGKPVLRVCLGLFSTQDEAHKQLEFLKENMEVKDSILRIYKK